VRAHGLKFIFGIAVAACGFALCVTAFADDKLAGKDHWAFRAPVRPSVPAVAGASGAIDAFVRARLQHEKLTPSPEADKRTLIRRVYFDVIGLPPTPEEIDAFVADADSAAYEKLVDRLLASPRYGERWARHWLDVVRFAESNGYETNIERRNAYHYRDWVINSLNADKPYDQFVREQLAGDALGADAGTGFIVGGTTDIVKSPDPVLTANQRADELHDMVSTTGSAFLGLTVGCARCHDHKFDPISQVEYYRMIAVFAGVQHGERAMHTPETRERAERVAALKKSLAEVDAKLAAYEPVARPERGFVLVDEPTLTQIVPAIGREPHKNGSEPGQRKDTGDATRLPNVGRGYFYWNNVADKDVFCWNPGKTGQYRVWLSWGAGHSTHAKDASYHLDTDGDLATTNDRKEIARVNQQLFADGTGTIPNQPLWSGFRDAGVHELKANSKVILHGGANAADYVAADVLLLEEVPVIASEPKPAIRAGLRPVRNTDRFAPMRAKFVRFTARETSDAEPCIDEIEIYTTGDRPRNVALASSGAKVTASGTYPNSDLHKLEHVNDGRYGNEWSWISNEIGKGWVKIELPEAMEIDRVVWGRDRNQKFRDRLATRYNIEVAEKPGEWKLVARAEDRLPYVLAGEPEEIYSAPANEQAQLSSLIEERRSLHTEIKHAGAAELVAYIGTFQQPPATYRMSRGDPTQPKEQVTPGGIASVGRSLDLPAVAVEQQRRQKLAEWITDPSNPLTARVIVNRLWHYHFGQGLVNTPSDFGNMGAKPTHAELLDWLAVELVAQQWKLKPIHRLILLSATYRQSSTPQANAMERDAGNTMLWRFPPRRLEAEAIRDSMLAVSGKLDLTMGGPGFDVFKPNDNYVRVYEPKEVWAKPEWRRMVYSLKVRSQHDATFGAFDCPDGAQIAPKRATSTTPLQALNLMNGSFVLQQSEFLAERVRSDAGLDPASQAERSFRLAFGRAPTANERGAAAKLIGEHGLAALCRALFNANEFVYVR
jgi:hypothetical protein